MKKAMKAKRVSKIAKGSRAKSSVFAGRKEFKSTQVCVQLISFEFSSTGALLELDSSEFSSTRAFVELN